MAYLQCSFYAKSLMRTVDITVILPTDKALFGVGYAQKPKRFKTLYLLHGIFGSCQATPCFRHAAPLSRLYPRPTKNWRHSRPAV